MDVTVDPWFGEVRAHLQGFLLGLHHASVLLRVDTVWCGPQVEADTVILLLRLLQLLAQLHSFREIGLGHIVDLSPDLSDLVFPLFES